MFPTLRQFTGPFDLRRFPWVLLGAALLLVLIGTLFITSAKSFAYAQRQLIFLAVGLLGFFAVALFDYRHLAALAAPAFGVGVLMLGLLPVLGVEINNARRWYDLGAFHMQPSELVKYMVVVALATYFAYCKRVDRLRDLILPLGITLIPIVLIVLQPDLGTAMLFLPVFFGVAFLAGVPFRNLALVAAAGCVLLVGAWLTPGVLHDYQKRRLTAFINPGANPHSAAAYNARQATLAVAGGGWTGQGWGEGVLNRMRRIPERHTDFIFPVIAEEWGFVRSTAFIAFYLLLLGLIARIAWDTHGQFGRLLVGGILTLLAVQGLLHLAISLRLAPITGLTLPFISYGGSSLVVSMAGLGLVAGVRIRSEFVPSQRSY